MQRTHGLATAVILAAAGLSTGCASMPKPSWFGKLLVAIAHSDGFGY